MKENKNTNSKKWFLISILLFLLLIATNLFWFYNILDQGSIKKYSDQMLYEKTESLNQFLKIYPHIKLGMNKDEVIQQFQKIDSTSNIFEKEGKLHINFLSFTFDSSKKLIKIEEQSSF